MMSSTVLKPAILTGALESKLVTQILPFVALLPAQENPVVAKSLNKKAMARNIITEVINQAKFIPDIMIIINQIKGYK